MIYYINRRSLPSCGKWTVSRLDFIWYVVFTQAELELKPVSFHSISFWRLTLFLGFMIQLIILKVPFLKHTRGLHDMISKHYIVIIF